MKEIEFIRYRNFSVEIVKKAAQDWQKLIRQSVRERAKGKLPKNWNDRFIDLRAFFNSTWCAFLVENEDLPQEILRRLEKELAEAMEDERRDDLSQNAECSQKQ